MAEWLIAPVLKTGIVLRTIGGSNPSLSNNFLLLQKWLSFFVFFPFFHRKKDSARWDSRARTEKKQYIE